MAATGDELVDGLMHAVVMQMLTKDQADAARIAGTILVTWMTMTNPDLTDAEIDDWLAGFVADCKNTYRGNQDSLRRRTN